MWSGDNYVVPGANPSGGVASVSAGTGVTITGTPSNPIINSLGTALRPTFTIYVAPNGNDTTADGSIGLPFATIQAALVFRFSFPAAVIIELFLFPGSYTGNITIDKGNTYFTANASPYRDQKSAIITGNITVLPLTPSGLANTITAFTNILFSLSTFNSNTAQPEPNYITFTNCAMIGFSATHSILVFALTTIVQYVDCFITNNTLADTITNNGALLKVLRTEIANGSASTSCIVNAGSAPRMDLQYSFIQNNANSQNLDSLVKYNNSGASTQNTVSYNTFQYIAGSMDVGGTKAAIRYNHTGSIITQIMAYNTFITAGSTNALKKPGVGTVTIINYGGNFGTEIANVQSGIARTIILTNT